MVSNPDQMAQQQQLSEQLKSACGRLDSAHKARDRLIAQAHGAGLSMRKIAAATGLSPSRVHQVLRAQAGCAPAPGSASVAPLSDHFLKKIPLFCAVDDLSLAALSRHAVLRNFPKQAILINEGDRSDSLYLILSGSVQVYASDSDGKEVLLASLSAGDYFGELALLDDEPRSASVRTLEPCQVMVLSKAAFCDFLYQHPSVAQQLLRALAGMVRQDNDRTKGLALMGVYQRLVQTLLALGEKRGEVIVVDNVTHQGLAEQVYASREMVTLILKELKQGDYIGVDQHRIVIKKPLPAKW